MTMKLVNKRILITGGSGFIGSYLLENLIQKNKICVIDNEYRGSNIDYLQQKNLKSFQKNALLKR